MDVAKANDLMLTAKVVTERLEDKNWKNVFCFYSVFYNIQPLYGKFFVRQNFLQPNLCTANSLYNEIFLH